MSSTNHYAHACYWENVPLYEWSKWGNTRISRVQASTPSSEAIWTKPSKVACETKEEHQRRLQLHREARKGREQNRRAEERSQEAQKRLKAQRQGGASRYQCQTAEQSARRLPDNSKLNAHHHKNETTTATQLATKVLTQPASSYSETMWAKTSKTWTWPCSQTLISGFNMRVFPLFLEESFSGSKVIIGIEFEYAISCFAVIAAIQIVWTVYHICVSSRFDFHWGSRTLSVWLQSQVPWSYRSRATGDFNLSLVPRSEIR